MKLHVIGLLLIGFSTSISEAGSQRLPFSLGQAGPLSDELYNCNFGGNDFRVISPVGRSIVQGEEIVVEYCYQGSSPSEFDKIRLIGNNQIVAERFLPGDGVTLGTAARSGTVKFVAPAGPMTFRLDIAYVLGNPLNGQWRIGGSHSMGSALNGAGPSRYYSIDDALPHSFLRTGKLLPVQPGDKIAKVSYRAYNSGYAAGTISQSVKLYKRDLVNGVSTLIESMNYVIPLDPQSSRDVIYTTAALAPGRYSVIESSGQFVFFDIQ